MEIIEEKEFNGNDNDIKLKKRSKDNLVNWCNSMRDDEVALLSNM